MIGKFVKVGGVLSVLPLDGSLSIIFRSVFA